MGQGSTVAADETPAARYRTLAARHGTRLAEAERASSKLATARGATFVAILGFLFLVDVLDGPSALASFLAAALLTAAVAVLVGRHRRARARALRHETLRSLALEGSLRLARDWERLDTILPLAERPEEPADPDHPYSQDLHIGGRASLMRLAGPLASESGRRTLRRWFLEPDGRQYRELRAKAAAELSSDLAFRMELACLGRLAGSEDPEALDALLEWARRPRTSGATRRLRVTAWGLPASTLVLGGLHFVGVLPALWVLPLVAQIWWMRRASRRIASDVALVERGAPAARSRGPQLRLIENADWEAELLLDVKKRLLVSGEPLHSRLQRLGRLVDLAESRRNLVFQALNPLLLLEVHLGFALDDWRGRFGSHLGVWLSTLGEVEALGALASLAHDHPDWTFPSGPAGAEGVGPMLRARRLGHPLLAPDECVRNDVEVGPPGTFLLVTGSNMSGKSTLLRAIGTNVVLAAAGGPVCAEALELPRIRLHTSMTVNDSLEEGVSRFMAELLRVRSIVRAARDVPQGGVPVLYLLDELLQGTNSAERKVAARAILRHLLDGGALGALTTHDLTLHEAPDLAQRARPWHFRESVTQGDEGTVLDFDYQLRPGLATTSNALKLLEAVGLGAPRDKGGAIG